MVTVGGSTSVMPETGDFVVFSSGFLVVELAGKNKNDMKPLYNPLYQGSFKAWICTNIYGRTDCQKCLVVIKHVSCENV